MCLEERTNLSSFSILSSSGNCEVWECGFDTRSGYMEFVDRVALGSVCLKSPVSLASSHYTSFATFVNPVTIAVVSVVRFL
jgi:hypothetical protein